MNEAAPTPHLMLNLHEVELKFAEFQRALPGVAVHYAVKANPDPALLSHLAAWGARFDVASPNEVRAALAAGADPHHLLYSNPVKAREHIRAAYADGARLFVADSAAEVLKLAETAPGSTVLARLLTSGAGSDWPLSRKFGSDRSECVDLLVLAAENGLIAGGITFHVGSQQRYPEAWDEPVDDAAQVFERLREVGLQPTILDLGGGFPADLDGTHPRLTSYGATILAAVERAFANQPRPTLIAEPGRGLVADAGVLVSSVISVCQRGDQRWVYLDAGVFTGLVETLDEAIRYRLTTSAEPGPTAPAVLAGPSCDSADVLYEKNPVDLPVTLAEGDLVRFHAAGAYTTAYTTAFNGFDPLTQTVLDG